MSDICAYNVRGLNNKQSYIKDFLLSNKISLVALLETRVPAHNANLVSSSIAPNFTWEFNYCNHNNGRIWLGWDPTFWTVNVVETSS